MCTVRQRAVAIHVLRPSLAAKMGALSFTIAILSMLLELSLLLRAWRAKLLHEYPKFFGYLAFVFVSSCGCLFIFYYSPGNYGSATWFMLLAMFLAEFAVLLEVSDHVFEPYPSVRLLGRLVTLTASAVFFALFIFPLLFEHQQREWDICAWLRSRDDVERHLYEFSRLPNF